MITVRLVWVGCDEVKWPFVQRFAVFYLAEDWVVFAVGHTCSIAPQLFIPCFTQQIRNGLIFTFGWLFRVAVAVIVAVGVFRVHLLQIS